MIAVIRRGKHYSPQFKCEWKWLYTVEISEIGLGSTIGNRLAEAVSFAKRHGATKVIKEWQS